MLTPRLEMILKYVTGSCVADIGTDHAYVPIKIAENGIRVIAADISRGPLESARRNVDKAAPEVRANIELRLGGGLEPISEGEADTVIIAGMGGDMIWKILSDSPDKAKQPLLLLQPMNSQAELRNSLFRNGFIIETEDLANEGHKIYNLICARFTGKKCTAAREIDLHLPPVLYGHPLFSMLYEKKQREFAKVYKGLSGAAEKDKEAIGHYLDLLGQLEKVRSELGI